MSIQTDPLEYLMALYYNEDYFDDYGGLWETFDAFLEEDPQLASPVPALVTKALSEFPIDADLAHYLREVGCAYNTALYPGGVRAWLTEISRRIEAWLDTHQQDA